MKIVISIILSIFVIAILLLDKNLNYGIKSYESEIKRVKKSLNKIKKFSKVNQILKDEIFPILNSIPLEKDAEDKLIKFYKSYKNILNLSIDEFITKRKNYFYIRVNSLLKRDDLNALFTLSSLKKEFGFLNIKSLNIKENIVEIDIEIIQLYR